MNAQDPESLYTTAQTLVARGEMAAAEIMLRQATELESAQGSTVYKAGLAALLGLQGRADESLTLLNEELEQHPEDSRLLVAYGMTKEAAGDIEEAEEFFRKAVDADPEYPAALHGLACRLRERGEMDEAEKLACKAFARAPEHAGFALTACEILEQCDKADLAFEVAELAAHYNPEEVELVQRAVEGALARDLTERAWNLLAESDVEAPWVAGWKATILDLEGRSEEAERILEETRELGRQDTIYLFLEACIFNRRGDVEVVQELVERIFTLDPDHAGAHKLQAEISMEKTADVREALEPLEKAYELSGEPEIGWELVASYYAAREYEKALRLGEALGDNPDLPATLRPTFAMLCHAALDQSDEASRFLAEIPPEMAMAALGEMERGGSGSAAEARLRASLSELAARLEPEPPSEPAPDDLAEDAPETEAPPEESSEEPEAPPAALEPVPSSTRAQPAEPIPVPPPTPAFAIDPRVFSRPQVPQKRYDDDEWEWVEVEVEVDDDDYEEVIEEVLVEEPSDVVFRRGEEGGEYEWVEVEEGVELDDDDEYEWIEIEEEVDGDEV